MAVYGESGPKPAWFDPFSRSVVNHQWAIISAPWYNPQGIGG